MAITSLRIQTYHIEFVRDWKPREPDLALHQIFWFIVLTDLVKCLVFLMSICVDNYSIAYITLDRFVRGVIAGTARGGSAC